MKTEETAEIEITTTKCPNFAPWGNVDQCNQIAPGIWIVSTPSHGGAYVAPELWNTLPDEFKETPYSHNGWYEEDCDIVIPLQLFSRMILSSGIDAHTCQMINDGKVKVAFDRHYVHGKRKA